MLKLDDFPRDSAEESRLARPQDGAEHAQIDPAAQVLLKAESMT
jgi:hypothetical protein